MRGTNHKKKHKVWNIATMVLIAALVVLTVPSPQGQNTYALAQQEENSAETEASAETPVQGEQDGEGTETQIPEEDAGEEKETPDDVQSPAENDTPVLPEASQIPLPSPSASTIPQEGEEVLLEQTEELLADAFSIVTNGLDTNEAMVDNFADLKTVLENDTLYAGIDTIYLNGTITYVAGGILIGSNRKNVTIVGHPKGEDGVRNQINDIAGGIGNVIRPRVAGTSITVKDAVINGKNYYGPVMAEDAYPSTIIYDNVTYKGPQIVFNRRGLVRFLNSDVTIMATGGDEPQEVGEIAQLEIGGVTTIKKTDGTNSMFWFAGNNGTNQYIRVLPGADATVLNTTSGGNNDFIYVEGAGNTTNQKPTLTVGVGASFSVTTRDGLQRSGHKLEGIVVEENGRLNVVHTGSNNAPTIRLNTLLQVGTGATLNVQRAANSNTEGLVKFASAGGKVQINHPNRILLYNPYGGLIKFTPSGTITATVDVINNWTANTGASDSIDNMPNYIWNKNDSTTMNMSATASGTAITSASISNTSADDPNTDVFSNATFNTYTSYMIAMGSYYLDIDAVYQNSRQITGKTEGSANVKITYNGDAGTARELLANANADGNYVADVPDSNLILDETVLALSHYDFLKARHKTTVLENPGTLSFLNVPSKLAFADSAISAVPQLIGRQDPGWALSVSDTRGAGNEWSVQASIAQPLTGTSNGQTYTLPGALVYIEGATSKMLGKEPLQVYSGTTGSSSQTDITWAAKEGILVSLDGGEGCPNVEYNATIEWTLLDAP